MHPDLKECIESAKENRQAIRDKIRGVKEANAINNADGIVISAHTLDLRRQVFEATMAGTIATAEATAGAVEAAGNKLIESEAA